MSISIRNNAVATNVFRSKLEIMFSDTPAEFFGWYVSDSAGSHNEEYFNSNEQLEKFIALVQERSGADEYDAEECAAELLFMYIGKGNDMCEFAPPTAMDKLAEYDDWREAMDAINSEPDGS